ARPVFRSRKVGPVCYPPRPLGEDAGLFELAWIPLGFAATSSIYFAAAGLCAVRAARARSRAATSNPDRTRASVLIPVAGKEPRLRANLEAAVRALSDGDELIVGAASARDPALEVAREVALANPDRVLVVAGSPSAAKNRKVAALELMEARARRPAIVL